MDTGFKYFYNDAFSFDTVQNFIQICMAIKADHDGLILGRRHAEGWIYFLFRDGDQYLLQTEAEGFEFVSNQGAAHYCSKFFHILNNYEEHSLLFSFQDHEPHKEIKTLDANLFIDDKFLIFKETSMTLTSINHEFHYTLCLFQIMNIQNSHNLDRFDYNEQKLLDVQLGMCN